MKYEQPTGEFNQGLYSLLPPQAFTVDPIRRPSLEHTA
jgi:hypothetical protein